MNQVKIKLEEAGIKPSIQRLKIYKYLADRKTHPSVEMIYDDLHQEMPTLSKTTVYNTLKLLSEKKLVAPITIEEDHLRFDADTAPHGHFKCRNCGALIDFSFSTEVSSQSLPKGFVPEYSHMYAWGICEDCNKKNS